MRNIGGSVGIAITSTILQRQRQITASRLGENLTGLDETTRTIFEQVRGGFIAAGADAYTATQRAYAALHGMVLREASMVSFVMLFRLLGVIFLALIPLVAIMSRPQAGSAPAPGAH
jgi:DHA2 family multidrug resistance protein